MKLKGNEKGGRETRERPVFAPRAAPTKPTDSGKIEFASDAEFYEYDPASHPASAAHAVTTKVKLKPRVDSVPGRLPWQPQSPNGKKGFAERVAARTDPKKRDKRKDYPWWKRGRGRGRGGRGR